ncbi:transposase [Oscillatoria sp. HE19RPO]|uniref:transposase n=1 Tax=Oscillatoria sp. HE19RPO TaxID=2954806 RepID=UPI0020C50E16|nr:transposase [Oscillatoria sp. HE19RPO]
MKYNPEIHHRRSIRLPFYDYSQPGAYFITLCTTRKQCWLGKIYDGKMHLNHLGQIVQVEWLKSAEMRPNIRLDEWVVMPNHLHGIVWILEAKELQKTDLSHGLPCEYEFGSLYNKSSKKSFNRKANSLSSFIGGFKGSVTRKINQLCKNPSIPIWQRNYYESIIEDEKALDSIREYIQLNPQRWGEDPDHPQFQDDFSELFLDLEF